MKKNGFASIETIITIVILASSLLYLYNSYSVILSEEEIRLTYDDAAYITIVIIVSINAKPFFFFI